MLNIRYAAILLMKELLFFNLMKSNQTIMKNQLTLFLLILGIFASCKGSTENTEDSTGVETTVESLNYTSKSVKKMRPDCEGEESDCLFYQMNYIEITNEDFQYINDSIQVILIGKSNDYESVGDELLKDYQEYLQEDAYAMPWESSSDVSVDLNQSGIFAVTCSEYSYMGGAHGMSVVNSMIFDLENKKVLKFYDFVNESDSSALKALAEKYFRLDNELAADADLNEIGYFWDTNGKLYFNDNFTITKKGLMMTYNPYEIAPYAAGMPSFEIPYEDLKPYLTENSPLKRL